MCGGDYWSWGYKDDTETGRQGGRTGDKETGRQGEGEIERSGEKRRRQRRETENSFTSFA
jgi:hypothetical protein